MKTIGSRDLRARKRRKDKGKKRKVYNGKPVKGIRRIRFEKKIGNKSSIHLFIREKKPMSYDGLMRFPNRIRSRVHRFVYPKALYFRKMPISEISNKYLIQKLCEDNLWVGTFYLMGSDYCNRSKYKHKWKTMCVVEVKDTTEGLRARIIQDRRLWRYRWFFKND